MLDEVKYIIKTIIFTFSPIIECDNIYKDADCMEQAYLCAWSEEWRENCALTCGLCGMQLIYHDKKS